MLQRLLNALRYLFTGQLPDAKGNAIAPASTGRNTLIMRDHIATAQGKSVVEVRSDGIHIIAEDSTDQQLIPLNADGDSLSRVDENIRSHITHKLTLLLPELSGANKEELINHVFGVLALLANDQLPRIRQMIAEELGDLYNAPAELIKRLAWDDALEVSAPILEFSPLLGDNDLLDIIAESKIPGIHEVISRRKEVSEGVAGALVNYVTQHHIDASGERTINNLLENPNAHLNDDALLVIAEEAEYHQTWHVPLISRPNLTIRTINTIARFVSHSLIADMESRKMISKEMGENLSKAVTHRLQNPHHDREKEADKQALDLYTQGLLDNEYIAEALEAGEKELVVSSLCLISRIPKFVVRQILAADDPKGVTALAWKAQMPMRSAIQVQLKLAKIHYSKILYAKNGQDFPLSEEEMQKILENYATKAA